MYRFIRATFSESLHTAFARPLTAIPSTESIFGVQCSATRRRSPLRRASKPLVSADRRLRNIVP